MNTAALYHRPESEFCYLYKDGSVHVRLRTAKDDIQSVKLIYADPYKWASSGVGNADNTNSTNYWVYETKKMKKLLSDETSDFYQTEVTVPTKRMDYVFVVEDQKGKKFVYTDKGVLPYKKSLLKSKYAAFRLPYFHQVDAYHAPSWVRDMVWYQIFPERFANGDTSNDPEKVKDWSDQAPDRQDFYGGDLQGVLDHLDHLVDLGVNGIYFCPIFKSPTNHKYDTEDYLEIDPHFGTKELFKTLVEEAHKRGLKVMLDAVFNHIGDTSPFWQDVLQNQEHSKYAAWFHVNSWPVVGDEDPDNFENSTNLTFDTFAFTPHMPKLNTANPEVQAHLLHIAEYWIREFDIDAWRLDVADEVDHQFWKKFRTTCDAAKKDFYILGEVWHSSQPWLNGDEFSAVMNYAYTGAISDFFVKRKISMPQMISAINDQLMLYRKETSTVMFNCLDSHDTPRFLTECKEDKNLFKQVEAFTYLNPGSPCIYYGDEVGLTGGMDPDCRRPMIWDEDKQDKDLYAFFKDLVAFRKENAELLADGTMDWCVVSESNGVLQLERKLGKKRLIGTFNTGKKAVDGDLKGVLLSNRAKIDGKHVTIKPKGFVISRG
ncbi:MAG: glycoside hydrolase family 13 protein [Streptococcaceae bacterium]|jgi:glycosidase|nr:glycoside hydrolase family 13 protein [Streptococcaceae bacterium]